MKDQIQRIKNMKILNSKTTEILTDLIPGNIKLIGRLGDKLKVSNPTLRIAQGTKLNVVVNQDLQLPIFKQNK